MRAGELISSSASSETLTSRSVVRPVAGSRHSAMQKHLSQFDGSSPSPVSAISALFHLSGTSCPHGHTNALSPTSSSFLILTRTVSVSFPYFAQIRQSQLFAPPSSVKAFPCLSTVSGPSVKNSHCSVRSTTSPFTVCPDTAIAPPVSAPVSVSLLTETEIAFTSLQLNLTGSSRLTPLLAPAPLASMNVSNDSSAAEAFLTPSMPSATSASPSGEEISASARAAKAARFFRASARPTRWCTSCAALTTTISSPTPPMHAATPSRWSSS